MHLLLCAGCPDKVEVVLVAMLRCLHMLARFQTVLRQVQLEQAHEMNNKAGADLTARPPNWFRGCSSQYWQFVVLTPCES